MQFDLELKLSEYQEFIKFNYFEMIKYGASDVKYKIDSFKDKILAKFGLKILTCYIYLHDCMPKIYYTLKILFCTCYKRHRNILNVRYEESKLKSKDYWNFIFK